MKLLCKLFHNYEIGKLVNPKGVTQTFYRRCTRCSKEQTLQRPKEYHPSLFIWVDRERIK